MVDASESRQTQPDPAPEAPSARQGTGKKGQDKPAASPAIMARVRLTNDLDASLRNHEAEVTQDFVSMARRFDAGVAELRRGEGRRTPHPGGARVAKRASSTKPSLAARRREAWLSS